MTKLDLIGGLPRYCCRCPYFATWRSPSVSLPMSLHCFLGNIIFLDAESMLFLFGELRRLQRRL